MRLDDVFYNSQTQPGAAGIAGTRFVHAIKTLEDTVDGLGRNARAIVCDRDLDLFLR